MATRLHTDREVLRCIFDMYEADYPSKGDPHLPVDLTVIAANLRCSPHLLFGRLHYDMGARLRHPDPTDPKKTIASIFESAVGDKRHFVNFPYLAAHLAQLDNEHRRSSWTRWLAIGAVVVACISAGFQIVNVAAPRPLAVTR